MAGTATRHTGNSPKSRKPAKNTPSAPAKMRAGAAEIKARKAVIATALEMSRSGLSPGRSGNVSQRFGDGMLITPSGIPYATLEPADIVYVGVNGEPASGALKPSSEWRFHLSAYHARPDGNAIVHTHSLHATVIACTGKSIPAFHYMVAIAGGIDIPCVPYATFGTDELARYVADGLRARNACLMANHGQITIAPTLDAALELAAEIEIIAEQYAKVLATGIEPVILEQAEMATVLGRFQSYGQNAQR